MDDRLTAAIGQTLALLKALADRMPRGSEERAVTLNAARELAAASGEDFDELGTAAE